MSRKSEQSEHVSEHVSEHLFVNKINAVNRVNTFFIYSMTTCQKSY